MKDNDFIDVSDDTEEIEMLDFENDQKVANQIDEMLDFIELPTKSLSDKKELDQILETSKTDHSVKIDASKEKIDDYVPSIRDFNIKSAKKRKIVQKVMVYTIILMLIGFEFFIEKAGSTLKNLKVYASNNQPIRIVQNEKYGYIDYTGDKIVNPKYNYGENFIKGYAIVKNSSNLPLIIDKGGKEVVKTGTYFTIYRANTDIIATKLTKAGYKYGVLDENLSQKVAFEYDSINYFNYVYTYTKGNEVGLINLDGKKIYSYKLSDSDDKKIIVSTPTFTNNKYVKYGVVKVNSSSLIVNLQDGTVVSNATLNEIVPEENNVFYEIKEDKTKQYMYVQGNKILLESENYSSMSIPSIETGVIRAINNNFSYEFISTKTLEQLQKNLSDNQTYYGDNIFIYKIHDYKKNKDVYNLVRDGEVYKTIDSISEIVKSFNNGAAVIKYTDGKYGFINESGNFVTNDHYDEASEFDSYGDAIVKKDGYYGVINISGKTVIDFKNISIKMASGSVKKYNLSNDNNVFYAVMQDNKYALYNSNGKRVNKTFYNDVIFNDNYPIIKVSTDANDLLITTNDMDEIKLTSFQTEYDAYENYIVIKNEYYNYEGKMIYIDNSKGE